MQCTQCGTTDQHVNRVCKCERFYHAKCLARYQFTVAGTIREVMCLDCKQQYPLWGDNLVSCVHDDTNVAMLQVVCKGKKQVFAVRSGADGRDKFKRQLQRTYALKHEPTIDIRCTVPGTKQKINFTGWDAFEAAVYCASLAQKRQTGGVDQVLVA